MSAARISSRWLVSAPVSRWNTPLATDSRAATVTATVPVDGCQRVLMNMPSAASRDSFPSSSSIRRGSVSWR